MNYSDGYKRTAVRYFVQLLRNSKCSRRADTANTSTALSIQYDNVFQFNRVSSDVKEFLFGFLSVDYDEKRLKAAFKAASKGK